MDRASWGREVEAEVGIIRGRGEAGEETGRLHRTGEASAGVGLVVRATTHRMVTVSTHPEEGVTLTHPGVAGEISLPGGGGESTPRGEDGEVVEEAILQPQLGRVKVTSALKCCKIHGRSCGEIQKAGVRANWGNTKGKGKVARCYRKKRTQVRM